MILVFFDIDGTLIAQGNQKIPTTAIKAVQQLRHNGHLAILNTGRPISTIQPEILSIGFDGIIASCGTSIRYKDQILLEETIPKGLLRKIIPLFDKHGVDVVLEGPEYAYVSNIHSTIYAEEIRRCFEEKRNVFRSWNEQPIVSNKITYKVKSNGSLKPLLSELKRYFTHIKYADNAGDLILKGHNKASGIRYLLDYLNFPRDNTYAFGDSANDLDMLQFVRYGIAMGNAEKEVLNISDYITSTVEDDGIEKGLKHFRLI